MDDRTNILLVDDKHANLIAMQTVLEPLGQILITAQSGKKALKLLLDRDFAVILLDVNARMKERDLAHEQQRIQELQAKLDYCHALGTKANLPVGEAIYGSRSIRWISPPAFHELADSYGRVLDQSLEALTLKIDHDITGQLRQLAETMGFLRAGPRDVAEVHTQVLAAKT